MYKNLLCIILILVPWNIFSQTKNISPETSITILADKIIEDTHSNAFNDLRRKVIESAQKIPVCPGYKVKSKYCNWYDQNGFLNQAIMKGGESDKIVTQTLYHLNHQAEEADMDENVAIDSVYAGFSGSGYVKFSGDKGRIVFNNIDGGEGGTGFLIVRYASWFFESEGVLSVNGKDHYFQMQGTSGWDRWKYIQQEITLFKGKLNTIKIEANKNRPGNLDNIIVIPPGREEFVFVSDTNLLFHSQPGEQKVVNVFANTTWIIKSKPDWIVCSSPTGSGYSPLSISTKKANANTGERKGYVCISNNEKIVRKITICQAGHQRKTYYVDNEHGDDRNSGDSKEDAWQSLDKVNHMIFGPGDSILLKRGCRWTGTLAPMGSGSENTPVVISRYGPGSEKPVISANGAREAILLENIEYVILENLSVTNPAEVPNRTARGIRIYADQARSFKDIIIRNNEIYQVIGWVKQSKRYASAAIYLDTQGPNAHFVNVKIENNYIHDCTTRGITGNASSINWQDTTYMHNHIYIRNNRIFNTGCDAIRTIASKNVIVEKNTIYNTGSYTKNNEAKFIAACFPQQCGNTIWQHNEIAYTAPTYPPHGDMDSQAFDIDHDCCGTHIFQYNYSHDNFGGFLLVMGESIVNKKMGPLEGVIIRYNISQNDGPSFSRLIELHNFNEEYIPIKVYNNLFYYASGNMNIQTKGAAFRGLEFKNNIFNAPIGSYPSEICFVNNLYFPLDPANQDEKSIHKDPELSDPGKGEKGIHTLDGYKLSDGSPAINSGLKIPNNGGVNFWGDSLSETLNPNIGAY